MAKKGKTFKKKKNVTVFRHIFLLFFIVFMTFVPMVKERLFISLDVSRPKNHQTDIKKTSYETERTMCG